MPGNGKHTPYKHVDDWGMVYDCFTNINMNNAMNMLPMVVEI